MTTRPVIASTTAQQLDLAVVLIKVARECHATGNARDTLLYLRAADRVIRQLLEVTP